MAGLPRPPRGRPGEQAPDLLARRIGAALLDVLLLTLILIAVGSLGGSHAGGSGRDASLQLGSSASVVWIGIVLVYYFTAEATSGQTLGKRLLGLRVVALDGRPARPTQVATRTLLRLLDSLPFFYLLGLGVMLASGPRRQRIGDLAAGTVVARV